ncbi:MAG TPA: acetolactate synthase large subunit [Chloroflexia bacterium]|nr:acetolactate synthase large subunit [Chloroflexia bacterium]
MESSLNDKGESPAARPAADLLVQCLENEGVKYVFGLPGEEILDVLDALSRSTGIEFVLTRHEQGAAFMADVYGRLSTYPGVCLATLGPGATNLITGIADANLDCAPLVAITGQAGLERVHKESHQYIDVVDMLRPITKWNARVERPDALPEVVRKAFRLARLEKPGATHIELPEDVAAMPVAPDLSPMPVRRTTYPQPRSATLEQAAGLLCSARRPLVLAGNGVIRRQAAGHGATDALAGFVEQLGIPVTHTFMGKGCLDYRDPHALATVGLQRPEADLAAVPQLAEADLVVTIGYDLVEWPPDLWNPHRDKDIIHVDSTPAEIDGHYLPSIEVVGEIADALSALAHLSRERPHAWWQDDTQKRSPAAGTASAMLAYLQSYASDDAVPMKPQRVIWELRQEMGDDDILISDVGAHKVWLGLCYPAARPNTVVISNGFAAMGIAVPGGLAAKLARPERKVVAVSGDGGFLMNSQELETARRLGAAFVNVVWSDRRYALIEMNQQRRLGRTFGVEFAGPDLVQYTRSFGLPAWRVEQADDFVPLLRQALDAGVPSLIEVPIDHAENMKLGHLGSN